MAPEPKVIPAQLSFLAIYNQSLGANDETFQDQIIFWYSKTVRARRRNGQDAELERKHQQEENEKLRQIGLAQGMIDFAKYGYTVRALVTGSDGTLGASLVDRLLIRSRRKNQGLLCASWRRAGGY